MNNHYDAEDVLKHPTRIRIVGLIDESPMACKSELKEWLEVASGTLNHHLNVLERAELIKSMKIGKYKRYRRNGADLKTWEAIGVLRGANELALARNVVEHPGSTQVELIAATGLTRKTFGDYMGRLIEAGLVHREPEVRGKYFPCELLIQWLEQISPTAPAAPPGRTEAGTPDACQSSRGQSSLVQHCGANGLDRLHEQGDGDKRRKRNNRA